MPYCTVGKENGHEIKIYFEDYGEGDPVVLIHGFPFSGVAWEKQTDALLEEGYRVVTYDRRGFGKSSHPFVGYNYNVFTRDLDILLNELDLREVTLIGHSMGTGEATRYLGSYRSDRVRRGILIAPIPPFLLKADDNVGGLDRSLFEGFKDAVRKDRPAFLTEFLKNFYNLDTPEGNLVSEEKLRADFNLGVSASAIATLNCIETWTTDFRLDVSRVKVPMLIIQGDADRILPIEITGELYAKTIQAKLVRISGGSHGIPWTHADQINRSIFDFLYETTGTRPKKVIERNASLDLH